jgi:hypothetical protein
LTLLLALSVQNGQNFAANLSGLSTFYSVPFYLCGRTIGRLATLKLKPFKSVSSALPAVCVWREGPTGRLVCVNFVYFFATTSLLYLNICATSAVADVLQSTVLLLYFFAKRIKSAFASQNRNIKISREMQKHLFS